MVVRAETRYNRKRDEHFWRRHVWMLRSWSPLNWGSPEVTIGVRVKDERTQEERFMPADEATQDRFKVHKVELRRSAFAAGMRPRDLRRTDWEIDVTNAVLPEPKPILTQRLAQRVSEGVKGMLPRKRATEAAQEPADVVTSEQPEQKRSVGQKVRDTLEKANIVRLLWSTNPVAPKTVVYDFKDGAVTRNEYLGGLRQPTIPNEPLEEGASRITTTEQMKKVLFNPWLWKLGRRGGRNKLRMEIEGPARQDEIDYAAGEQLLRAGRDFKALSWARYLRGSFYGGLTTAAFKWGAAPLLLAGLSLAPAVTILTLPALPVVGALTLTVAGAFAIAEGIGTGIAIGNLAVPMVRYWLLGGKRQEIRWENRFNLLRHDREKNPLIELK